MPKIEGWIFDTLKVLFVLASWAEEFAIVAAHQGEAALHEADGTIAQIMRLPGALRDSLLAKKAFGDRAIGLPSLRPSSARKTKANRWRRCGGSSDSGGHGERPLSVRQSDWAAWARSSNERVQWQLNRLRRSGCRQFLHPHAMRGAIEPEHGMPAVRVLPQLAGRQSC